MTRLSAKQRISISSNAEQAILKYKGNHFLWHKYIHNIELDPMQLVKMHQMDQHKLTRDHSCRRTGKSFVCEMHTLEYMATQSDQSLGVVAPKRDQAVKSLKYHIDAIDRSEALTAYIQYKNGRKQKRDGGYTFFNNSVAECYGIMGEVDGGDLTIARLEEIDDVNPKRLFSNFLPMIISNRRAGAAKDAVNDTIIRITGVYKGASTITKLAAMGEYHELPVVNCHLGVELGLLNKNDIEMLRGGMTKEDFIRQMLCINVNSKNFIWKKWIVSALQAGLKTQVSLHEPVIGEEYACQGSVYLGYDAGGHGESETASNHAVVVIDVNGGYAIPVFVKTWAADTDDKIIRHDLLSIFRYFKPKKAIGDALGVGLISVMNDDLYNIGVTSLDKNLLNDGTSSKSKWPDWYFSPLQYEGMAKHIMFEGIQKSFSNNKVILPFIDDNDFIELTLKTHDHSCLETTYALFIKQLSNIIISKRVGSYAVYGKDNNNIGDDLFDALGGAFWAFMHDAIAGPDLAFEMSSVGTNEYLDRAIAYEQ